MDDFPGWLVIRSWKRRESLTETWVLTPPDQLDRTLAFWIRAAETDAWTREELSLLLAQCMDANSIPPALQTWVNDAYTGRLPPLKTADEPTTLPIIESWRQSKSESWCTARLTMPPVVLSRKNATHGTHNTTKCEERMSAVADGRRKFGRIPNEIRPKTAYT